jgi:hypothetical protein
MNNPAEHSQSVVNDPIRWSENVAGSVLKYRSMQFAAIAGAPIVWSPYHYAMNLAWPVEAASFLVVATFTTILPLAYLRSIRALVLERRSEAESDAT